MKQRFHRKAAFMAAALLAFGAHGAFAQHAGGPGHPPPGGGGFELEHALASIKAQLALNTSQQAMWDAAAAHGKTARQNGRAAMDQVHATLTAELAKAEPDFSAVAAAADAAQASSQGTRKQVRDEWLALYATFSPAQKTIVRDAIKARVDRMQAFREKMRERIQQRQGG